MLIICCNSYIIALVTTYTGTTGDCKWTLSTSDSTLVISGSGAMADYSGSSSIPWYNYNSYIKTVTIEDGVTSIGEQTFLNCSSLENVTIGSSVTSISDYAFTSLGSYAFEDCTSLTSVSIGSGMTSIGKRAFYDCTSLTSVTSLATTPPTCNSDSFSSSTYSSATLYAASTDYATATYWEDFLIIKYTDDVLNSTTTVTGQCGNNLTYTLSLTNGTLIIEGSGDMYDYSSSSYAPWYTYYRSCITSITISDEATIIGSSAFKYCTSLTSVTIPDCVTSIGSSAFGSCTSLTKIIISENVTSIGSYAFTGCSELTTIYSLNETPPTIKNTTFSDQYEYAKLYAAERYQSSDYWEKFYTIYINSGSCGDDLTWLYCDGTLTISGTGAMSNL